ncbi:hypothetical protein CLU85_1463 [Acidovorax sp. 69]|nr:hypothetical protein CLU85_1463 [Acidovorax sp. 69]
MVLELIALVAYPPLVQKQWIQPFTDGCIRVWRSRHKKRRGISPAFLHGRHAVHARHLPVDQPSFICVGVPVRYPTAAPDLFL